MTTAIILALTATLVGLAAVYLRLSSRHLDLLVRVASTEARAERAEARADQWRTAHERLAGQLAEDVSTAIDQAVAVTREARRVLPAPSDLDEVEAAAFEDIVRHLRSTDA